MRFSHINWDYKNDSQISLAKRISFIFGNVICVGFVVKFVLWKVFVNCDLRKCMKFLIQLTAYVLNRRPNEIFPTKAFSIVCPITWSHIWIRTNLNFQNRLNFARSWNEVVFCYFIAIPTEKKPISTLWKWNYIHVLRAMLMNHFNLVFIINNFNLCNSIDSCFSNWTYYFTGNKKGENKSGTPLFQTDEGRYLAASKCHFQLQLA